MGIPTYKAIVQAADRLKRERREARSVGASESTPESCSPLEEMKVIGT